MSKHQSSPSCCAMCFSMCGQIIYGIIMFVVLAMTLGAIFTPGWRQFSDEVRGDLRNLTLPKSQGLLPFACSMPGSTTPRPATADADYCDKWWKNLTDWERVVIVTMCLAVVAEVAALLWNCFTWCACCCKKYLIHPLSPLSFCVVLFLAISVIVYGINNESAFKNVKEWEDIKDKLSSEVGYSFWLATGALILAVVDTIVAGITVFCGERCC